MIKFGIIFDYTKDKRLYGHFGFFKLPSKLNCGYLLWVRYTIFILPCIYRDWEGNLLRIPRND